MAEVPEAREVNLRKFRPLAPPFHRHIARNRIMGKVWQVGDRVVVYEIVETEPAGKVLVTENSILRFE